MNMAGSRFSRSASGPGRGGASLEPEPVVVFSVAVAADPAPDVAEPLVSSVVCPVDRVPEPAVGERNSYHEREEDDQSPNPGRPDEPPLSNRFCVSSDASAMLVGKGRFGRWCRAFSAGLNGGTVIGVWTGAIGGSGTVS